METKTKKQQSHCWWFNSYNSPTSSPWLQSTLSEFNEKTQSMLKLIEEDADSFAQRAEMYYKKRPELISMVEDFYRDHRSLAERYDQLKSDRVARIRSPLTKSLSLPKEEYEYVFDSVNSVKSFDSFIEAACSLEECAESEIDDPEQEDDVQIDQEDQEREKPFAGGVSYDELMKLRDELDQLRKQNEIQKNIIKQKDEEAGELVKHLSGSVSELRELKKEFARVKEENLLVLMNQTSNLLLPFNELTKVNEMENRAAENVCQIEQVKKTPREVIDVKKKFEDAKSELLKLEKEAQTKIRYLKDALALKEEEKVEVTRKYVETKSDLSKVREERRRENELLKDAKDVIRHLKDEVAEKDEEKHEEIRHLNNALAEKDEEKHEAIRHLEDALLKKEMEDQEVIRELNNALAEKDEQKREAIRQLSVAMEILREEGKLLKKTLVNNSPKRNGANFQIFKGVNFGKLFY